MQAVAPPGSPGVESAPIERLPLPREVVAQVVCFVDAKTLMNTSQDTQLHYHVVKNNRRCSTVVLPGAVYDWLAHMFVVFCTWSQWWWWDPAM